MRQTDDDTDLHPFEVATRVVEKVLINFMTAAHLHWGELVASIKESE